jgi:hypothetical protein
MLFLNRINSWSKDRKERTDINLKTMTLFWNKPYFSMKYLDWRLFFLTIPKPLKQYTLFKKDYPFRSPSQMLI